MITSLIEMLELPNFGHITMQYKFSRVIKYFADVMDRNYNVITFQTAFILRRSRVIIFADIIKIVIMFIKEVTK